MDLSPLSDVSCSYRIPDGDVVMPSTPAPTSPPVSRRTLIAWSVCFGILASGPITAVIEALWP